MKDVNVLKAYNKESKIYDDAVGLKKWWSKYFLKITWGFADTNFIKSALDIITDDFSGKMLDIPVGTGIFTSEKYSGLQKAEIIGVDYSDGMLAKAKQEYARVGANVKLIQGDVANLPFADETFDVVLCMNGLPCFPEKVKSVTEILRVLKQGGSLAGTLFMKGERIITDIIFSKIFVRQGLTTPPFQTKEELDRMLKPYFRNVSIQVKGGMCCLCCTDKK